MITTPYLFNEIVGIFQNTAQYVIILECLLVFSVIWIMLYKRNGRKNCLKMNNDIIENYEPEPLVPDTDPNHPLLKTRLVQSRVGKMVMIDGFPCLNLVSHNYLGLLEDEQIMEDACRCIRKYGIGSCGPRGFYGTMDVHLELEERLAKYLQMEEAVVYSYGFSTIASAIPAYSKRGDVIFVDEAVSFAIQKGLDASRSTIYFYKHNDMHDLERLLIKQEERDKKNPRKAAKIRRFIVAEGIYLNTGELCPLPDLLTLRSTYKLRLFLDESVSFGALGQFGRGVVEHFNVDRTEIDLISAGMECALGTIGGFCAGSQFIIEHQRLSGLGYCFSASLPPLLAQAAISALDRFEREPQMFSQLKEIAVLIHSKFSKFTKMKLRGNELSPVKHLYITEDPNNVEIEQKLLDEISDKCIKSGIAVIRSRYLDKLEKNSIRPSLRITVNRLLTLEEIDKAFEVIENISRDIL